MPNIRATALVLSPTASFSTSGPTYVVTIFPHATPGRYTLASNLNASFGCP